jgi:hypothetical protein
MFTFIKIASFSNKKDPELEKFFNKNLNIINHYCTKDQYRLPFMSSVTFGKMEIPGAIAYCEPKINGFKLVFDERYWNRLSNINKTQLMFHEMAHCMFNEDHRDDPNHFMYYSMNDIDALFLAMQVHQYLAVKCGVPRG